MSEPTAEEIDTLADGVVHAMLAVSAITDTWRADLRESEGGENIVRVLLSGAEEGSTQHAVLTRAVERWPGFFEVLREAGGLFVEEEMDHVERAVALARERLDASELDDYRFALANVAIGTANAVDDHGHTADFENIGADEKVVISRIDSLFEG